jgi:hypothetical protein
LRVSRHHADHDAGLRGDARLIKCAGRCIAVVDVVMSEPVLSSEIPWSAGIYREFLGLLASGSNFQIVIT